MGSAPEVAVAFIIREKFSYALASLKRLYRLAEVPFTLYLVDGRYPAPLRAELEAFLADKENVVRIDAKRFLYPTEAMNLVLGRIVEPCVYFLQNDIMIGRGSLPTLLAAMTELDADVLVPEILDIEKGAPALHREADQGAPIKFVERDGKIHAIPQDKPGFHAGCQKIEYFENHALLMRTAALRAIAPLAPLSMHDHVDLSYAFWRQRSKAYFVPDARVLFAGSPPVALHPQDLLYFSFRWDPSHAQLSDRYVRERWRPAELFEPAHYIQHVRRALAPTEVMPVQAPAWGADLWPEELAAA